MTARDLTVLGMRQVPDPERRAPLSALDCDFVAHPRWGEAACRAYVRCVVPTPC